MRAIFTAFALFAVAVAACATPQAEAQNGAQAAAAERYVLDGAHTQVAFSIERFGFTFVLGRFETIEGEIMLDQANPERSSVNATIQTGSISSGNATRNEHLQGEIWLNAAQFPTMTFRSTSVRRTGETTAEVTGDLTIRGITQPVTLAVTLNQIGRNPANGGQAAGFSATTTISRTAFGVGVPRPPTTLIGDEIRITIEALGDRPPA